MPPLPSDAIYLILHSCTTFFTPSELLPLLLLSRTFTPLILRHLYSSLTLTTEPSYSLQLYRLQKCPIAASQLRHVSLHEQPFCCHVAETHLREIMYLAPLVTSFSYSVKGEQGPMRSLAVADWKYTLSRVLSKSVGRHRGRGRVWPMLHSLDVGLLNVGGWTDDDFKLFDTFVARPDLRELTVREWRGTVRSAEEGEGVRMAMAIIITAGQPDQRIFIPLPFFPPPTTTQTRTPLPPEDDWTGLAVSLSSLSLLHSSATKERIRPLFVAARESLKYLQYSEPVQVEGCEILTCLAEIGLPGLVELSLEIRTLDVGLLSSILLACPSIHTLSLSFPSFSSYPSSSFQAATDPSLQSFTNPSLQTFTDPSDTSLAHRIFHADFLPLFSGTGTGGVKVLRMRNRMPRSWIVALRESGVGLECDEEEEVDWDTTWREVGKRRRYAGQ